MYRVGRRMKGKSVKHIYEPEIGKVDNKVGNLVLVTTKEGDKAMCNKKLVFGEMGREERANEQIKGSSRESDNEWKGNGEGRKK